MTRHLLIHPARRGSIAVEREASHPSPLEPGLHSLLECQQFAIVESQDGGEGFGELIVPIFIVAARKPI